MSAAVNWIGYKTIVRKEIVRILRIWGQTVVPPAITMSLYFIIFGNLIGSRIGEMGDLPYMEFIVPGLVMMSVITNSYGNMVSSFFGAKFGHHIEELLISPLPNWIILAGYVTGALTRGLMVGGVVMLVSLFFTDGLEVSHPWITLSVLILTSIVWCSFPSCACGCCTSARACALDAGHGFDNFFVHLTSGAACWPTIGGCFAKHRYCRKENAQHLHRPPC
ncbi:MAG: ABC transporter permease [Gammaproteobacteria bacterium]